MSKKQREKRRQKAAQRRAARRKKKGQVARWSRPARPKSLLRQAVTWPVHECLVTKDWQKPGGIVQVLVARRSPTRQFACGVFLVDLGCLGVKDAFARVLDSRAEYGQLRRQIRQSQPMRKVNLNLAAKIVHEAIAYAEQLGFSPHRDSRDAMLVLGDADPSACSVEVPLGDGTGKPFFVSGPYDNVPRIMAKLERAVGREGFDYLVHVTDEGFPIDEGEWEEEEWDEDEADAFEEEGENDQ